jgi:hypothetical protein
MPIGAPGWPELACCTASIAKARMAFAISAVPFAVFELASAFDAVSSRQPSF